MYKRQVVSRVHGDKHPEFHEVHHLFDTINAKTKEAGSNKPDLNEEFAKLRDITQDYTCLLYTSRCV